MPGGGIVQTQGFDQFHERLGQHDVGRSAVGVIGGAGAECILYIKVPAQPFNRRVGIAQRAGIIIKERFIPRQAVSTKREQADHEIDDQQNQNGVLADFLQGGEVD